MNLYVVLDTKGAGRVLGVFDTKGVASSISERYPHYYHLIETRLNIIASDATAWSMTLQQSLAVYAVSAAFRLSRPGRVLRLWLVVDTLGAGRLIGAFSSSRRASIVASISRSYYRVHQLPLNSVSPEALDWTADDEQRDFLRGFID